MEKSRSGTTVIQGHSPEYLDEVRALFKEYQEFLGFDLCFQSFDDELATLPGKYAPPSGRILLAECDGKIAGCVALRKIGEGICEMKRLFVRAEFRGKGIGRLLAVEIINAGKEICCEKMRLDTVPKLREAIALYRKLGFYEIPPYTHNPVPGALFFEIKLRT